MRDELEAIRDRLLHSLLNIDKSDILVIMDGIGEIIDAAEKHHEDTIATIVTGLQAAAFAASREDQ